MNILTSLIPVIFASLSILALSGCKTAPEQPARDKQIKAFEVKLTTSTQTNAGATAELVLIVETPEGETVQRQELQFGKIKYVPGEMKTIKVKPKEPMAWMGRAQLKFILSTRSSDGYLPSQIWIGAISDQANRFALRDVQWSNKMFSTEPDDPEAVPPVVAATEWPVAHEY